MIVFPKDEKKEPIMTRKCGQDDTTRTIDEIVITVMTVMVIAIITMKTIMTIKTDEVMTAELIEIMTAGITRGDNPLASFI